MSKETQIKEMQTVINGAFFEDFRNGNGVCIKTISKHLYNAGYRKQGDVVREILTEFANMLKCHSFYMTDAYGEVNENIVTVKAIVEVEEELKKKYTEGEK